MLAAAVAWLAQLPAQQKLAVLLGAYGFSAAPLLFWIAWRVITQLRGAQKPITTCAASCPPPGKAFRAEDADALARVISCRRSVFPKHFSGAPIDRSIVEAMLEAANWAPTHGRTEPWRFVVLGRQAQEDMIDLTLKVLERDLPAADFEKKCAKISGKRAKDYTRVPVMLALCIKRRPPPPAKEMPEWEEVCAVACAVQNLWLTATARGAAGYWSSWTAEARDSDDMAAFLGLGPGDRCLGFFLLGTAAPGAAEAYRSTRGPVDAKVDWRLDAA